MSRPAIDLASDWQQLMRDHMATCTRPHPGPMTAEDANRIRKLLSRITYKKDWRFVIMEKNDHALVQLQTIVPDSTTGVLYNNNGRPLPMCAEMDDGFIIDLAFELVKEFEMHEQAEIFRLDGVDVYYPHKATGAPVFVVAGLRGVPLPTQPAELVIA